jgi:hypothetical protein
LNTLIFTSFVEFAPFGKLKLVVEFVAFVVCKRRVLSTRFGDVAADLDRGATLSVLSRPSLPLPPPPPPSLSSVDVDVDDDVGVGSVDVDERRRRVGGGGIVVGGTDRSSRFPFTRNTPTSNE